MNEKEAKNIVEKYIKTEESKAKEWAQEGMEGMYYEHIAELKGDLDTLTLFLCWYENEFNEPKER
jgi:hypothetical protein